MNNMHVPLRGGGWLRSVRIERADIEDPDA
jgi:hypothetical protein